MDWTIDWSCRLDSHLHLQYSCSVGSFSFFKVIVHLQKVARFSNRQINFDSVVLHLAVRRDYSWDHFRNGWIFLLLFSCSDSFTGLINFEQKFSITWYPYLSSSKMAKDCFWAWSHELSESILDCNSKANVSGSEIGLNFWCEFSASEFDEELDVTFCILNFRVKNNL